MPSAHSLPKGERVTKKQVSFSNILTGKGGQNWKWTTPPSLIPCIPHPPKLESGGRMLLISSFIELTHTHPAMPTSQPWWVHPLLFYSCFSIIADIYASVLLCLRLAMLILLSLPPDLPNWGVPEHLLLFLRECTSFLETNCFHPFLYFMHPQGWKKHPKFGLLKISHIKILILYISLLFINRENRLKCRVADPPIFWKTFSKWTNTNNETTDMQVKVLYMTRNCSSGFMDLMDVNKIAPQCGMHLEKCRCVCVSVWVRERERGWLSDVELS